MPDRGLASQTWGSWNSFVKSAFSADITMTAVPDPQVAAALSHGPGSTNMVKFEEDDDLTLHERLKKADKSLRRATDDLESAQFYYFNDPTDTNREKVKKAKARVRDVTQEQEEIVQEIAQEDGDEIAFW